MLELSGLARCFSATVSSEEVVRGKPAPDVYLETARRLGVEPALCVAVEDSHNGIRSAKAAGMRVVAIPNPSYPPDPAALAEADLVLGSIADVAPRLFHNRPVVGGEWCQARHVGVVLSGRLGVDFSDGTSVEFGVNEVFDVPPGHDGFTVGDERCVQIEWGGIRARAGFPTGVHSRVLRTLLFTDIIDSTELANRLGDARWRALLSTHLEAARAQLERFGGHQVSTTGDGMLATFDGPARAPHCAVAIRTAATRDDLHIRVGVHVGEVELVGADVRGVAVHEAARIMAAAADDEILVSDLTRALAGASGLSFEDRGTHELKGLDGEWRLAAFTG